MEKFKLHIAILVLLGLSFVNKSFSQPFLEIGGSATFELSKGQEDSHFYYNELHANNPDWRFSVRELNLLLSANISQDWSFHSRLLLRQKLGEKLEAFHLSQAELKWESKNRVLQFSGGRIINPFGQFYQNLLPRDRLFIINPLPYGYYINILDRVGYSPGLHEPNILTLNNKREWGMPVSYYEGYTNGIKGRWHFWPDTAFIDIGIVHTAPISGIRLSDPIHPSIVTRIEVHPIFPWRQGLSFAYGGFLQRDEVNQSIENLSPYKQILLGTDITLGYNYWELTGEVMQSWYRLPVYDHEANMYQGNPLDPDTESLRSFAGYATVKYELPFWVGSYVAYRYAWLNFNQVSSLNGSTSSWDDEVTRHSFVVGYQISRFILFKAAYSIQNVKDKTWELDTFRSSLTLYF